MKSDMWFYFFSQARAEGLNEDDAARVADENVGSYYSELAEKHFEEQQREGI